MEKMSGVGGYHEIIENKKPQIMAPRVTSLQRRDSGRSSAVFWVIAPNDFTTHP